MDALTKPRNSRAWNIWRCYRLPADYHVRNADAGVGIPAHARDLVRSIFQSLTEPQAPDSPMQWALADCVVNGVPSMAILGVVGEIATPVMVMPIPGMLLRNWCGDALVIVEHPALQSGCAPETAASAQRRMLGTDSDGASKTPVRPQLRNRRAT